MTLTGLPRFKQIINAVDTKDTSNMRLVPLQTTLGEHESGRRFAARAFANRLTRVSLRDVVASSTLVSASTITKDSSIGHLLDAMTARTLVASRSCGAARKRGTKKALGALFGAGEGSARFSSCAIEYRIAKDAAAARDLDPASIGTALSEFLGAEACVTWTPSWTRDWALFVRLPAVEADEAGRDDLAADTLRDTLLDHTIVNGLEYVRKAVSRLDGEWCIETDGSDLRTVSRLPSIDPLKTTSNNIQEIYELLGVEAAACLMQAELHRVLSFDGSHVDPRHTWLLSDTVTRSGVVNALNRHNMEDLGGSLLQCASFEQTLDVLETGAAFGKHDNLGGATEKLIVGQPVHVGTGAFSIISRHQASSAIFIKPLKMGAEGEAQVGASLGSLGPLLRKGPRSTPFSLPSVPRAPYSAPPLELANLFKIMRTGAARQIPCIVSCALEPTDAPLCKSDFVAILDGLRTYAGWHKRDERVSAIDVTHGDLMTRTETRARGETPRLLISHHAAASTSARVDMTGTDAGWSLLCEATMAAPSPAAHGVIPSCVVLRESVEFTKGYWVIRADQRWTGPSLHEAESCRAEGTTAYSITVILQRPWDLLEEERACSDADLARAAIDRAAACLAIFDDI